MQTRRRTVLELDAGVEIVGEAGEGRTAADDVRRLRRTSSCWTLLPETRRPRGARRAVGDSPDTARRLLRLRTEQLEAAALAAARALRREGADIGTSRVRCATSRALSTAESRPTPRAATSAAAQSRPDAGAAGELRDALLRPGRLTDRRGELRAIALRRARSSSRPGARRAARLAAARTPTRSSGSPPTSRARRSTPPTSATAAARASTLGNDIDGREPAGARRGSARRTAPSSSHTTSAAAGSAACST